MSNITDKKDRKLEDFLFFMDLKNGYINYNINELVKLFLNDKDAECDDTLLNKIRENIAVTIADYKETEVCNPSFTIGDNDSDIPCYKMGECTNKKCIFRK